MIGYAAAKALAAAGYPQLVRGQGPVPGVCPVWLVWVDGEATLEDMVYVGVTDSVPYYYAPDTLDALDWLEREHGFVWWRPGPENAWTGSWCAIGCGQRFNEYPNVDDLIIAMCAVVQEAAAAQGQKERA